MAATETIDRGRRAFLRGRHIVARAGLPLPWTDSESFAARCTTCGACEFACPEGIVKPGPGGLPRLEFAESGCSFCGACAAACPEALFDRNSSPALSLAMAIADGCLARREVVCQSCRDACPEGAIVFTPLLGQVARPRLDSTACTACGMCVSACPVSAISLQRVTLAEPEGTRPCE